MPFEQAYYTSSVTGIRGTHGFQINALSPGIPAALLERVERLGAYSPPVSAPARPTDEELDRFPLALFYQPLEGGAALLGQSKYVGKDYSGRFGNYFAHHLYVREAREAFHQMAPIALWRSPMWSTVQSETGRLDPLERLVAGDLILAGVDDLFHEPGYRDRVSPYLAAIQTALETRRRVIVVGDSDEVAVWIAFASYVLPRSLVLRLSFTTYAKNPYDTDALVTGTTPDTDFSFASYELDQFTVFDLHGDRSSRPTSRPFAEEAAAVFQTHGLSFLSDGAAFLDAVEPDLEVLDLEAAFSSYYASAPQTAGRFRVGPWLGWIAGTFTNWPAERAEKIFSSVLSVYSGSDGETELVLKLLGASTNAAVAPETRRRLEGLTVEWAIRHAAAAPVRLLQTLARLSLRPAEKNAILTDADMWAEAVVRCDNGERVVANCEMANALGLLEARPDIAEHVCLRRLAPQLQEPGTAAWVNRCAGSPVFNSLIRGIARHLMTSGIRGETVTGLSNLLQVPRTRLALFRAALELIRAEHPGSAPRLADAWRSCILRPKPSAEELMGAVQAMSEAEQGALGVAALVADLAWAEHSPRAFDEKWGQLSEMLLVGDPALSENQRATYSVVRSAVALHTGGDQSAMLAFTDYMRRLPGQWIGELVELACPYTLGNRIPRRAIGGTDRANAPSRSNSALHVALLTKGHAAAPRTFLDLYTETVLGYIKSSAPAAGPVATERLLSDWVAVEQKLEETSMAYYRGEPPPGFRPAELFWERLFPGAYALLGRKQRADFMRSLRQTPAAYAEFRSWQLRPVKRLALIAACTVLVATALSVAVWFAIPFYILRKLHVVPPSEKRRKRRN